MHSSPTPGQIEADQLYHKFGAVPSADGTFQGFPGLSVDSDILSTRYGFLTTGPEPRFLCELDIPFEASAYFEISLQFTSFPAPLEPRLLFDFGDGIEERSSVRVPIVSSGCGSLSFCLPRMPERIYLEPTATESLFALHRFELRAFSTAELAAADIPAAERKYDVVCFPIIDWEYRIQRPQHLMAQLAKHCHRVFYLDTRFTGLHKSEVAVRDIAPNIRGVSLPGNTRVNLYKECVSENTLERGLQALIKLLEQEEADEVVLLIQLPFWIPYAKELQKRFGWKIVYDCMDDHSGFENNTPAMLSLEHEAVGASDLLITTSQVLYDKMQPLHPRCRLIRNAGGYEHFSAIPARSESFLADFERPVIGYYGAVAEWFDCEALKLALDRHPEWTFVLIGHARGSLVESELAAYPNLFLLGEKPYDDLPQLVAGFDVCTIPFQRIPLTEATNPVKVYEYMATGKPIVSRRLPEVEPFSDVLYLYDTPEDFVRELEKAVVESSATLAGERRKAAAANTWEQRYDVLATEIDALYKKAAIVVVSYESLPLLRQCLASILANTQYPNFEVIVVDNASAEPVRDYLREMERLSPKIRVVLNDSNLGFSGANNQGIQLAPDAEYIVLLNNDTVVPPSWLNRLAYYASKPDIGLVGPVTNSIGNEAQIPVRYTSVEDMPRFARCHNSFSHSELFDIKVLAMYCVAIRREVLEKVGLLDEDYTVGMFEDDDYSHRVRLSGYRVICAEDIFVHHYGRASFAKLSDEVYRAVFNNNRAVYERKWGPWVPHVYRP